MKEHAHGPGSDFFRLTRHFHSAHAVCSASATSLCCSRYNNFAFER